MAGTSNLERELIISYLAQQRVALDLFCAEDGRQKARIETGAGASVSKDGIITVDAAGPAAQPVIEEWARGGKKITAVFYFRKLGLKFNSAVQKKGNSFIFSIPQEISRVDEKAAKESPVTANVYFSLSEQKNVSFLCEPAAEFPLFAAKPTDAPREREIAASRARAFATLETGGLESLDPIEGRAAPLSIVFLSDTSVTLGGKTESFPLKTGYEYAVQISCAARTGRRIIHATLTAGEIFTAANSAAVCPFTSIQTEDRRFLFEKLYGTIFAGTES
jgi:hypothetical protein